MDKKYFTIDYNEKIQLNSEFCLTSKISSIIALDLSGNSILIRKGNVFLFSHDTNPEYIKLFDNIDDFYKNTYFYDEIERDERYDLFISENEHILSDVNYIPEKKLYISTVIKHIGSKNIIEKYKEGSYYNLSKSFLEGSLTKEEFEILKYL